MNCRFKLYDYDQHLCNDAINRLRSSGSSVPKKITGKYIYELEQAKKNQNREFGNKILIIADYNTQNDVETLLNQIYDLRYKIGQPKRELVTRTNDFGDSITTEEDLKDADGNVVPRNTIFQDFRTNVGYDTELINLKKNVDSVSAAQSAGSLNINEDVNGQIQIANVSSLIKDKNGSPTGYSYYNGEDLTIDSYALVIIFTKTLPFTDITNDYAYTELNQGIYLPFYIHEVNVNEYHPQLGRNLQNYIYAGGNMILGNNVWQNIDIPNFSYDGIPFIKSSDYKYAIETYSITNINLLIPGHPLLKNCLSKLSLQPPKDTKSVISNIVIDRDATLLATIADPVLANVPFLAIKINRNFGRTVAINSYLGCTSTDNTNGNYEFAKIVFNAIYWCFKINN